MHCSVISLLCNSFIFHHPSFPWSSSSQLFLKHSSHQSHLCHPIMFFHSFAIQPNILQLQFPISSIMFVTLFHSLSWLLDDLTFFLYNLPIFYSLLSLHFVKHVSCTLLTFIPSIIRCQVIFQVVMGSSWGHKRSIGVKDILYIQWPALHTFLSTGKV